MLLLQMPDKVLEEILVRAAAVDGAAALSFSLSCRNTASVLRRRDNEPPPGGWLRCHRAAVGEREHRRVAVGYHEIDDRHNLVPV